MNPIYGCSTRGTVAVLSARPCPAVTITTDFDGGDSP
jgi:hypothetical protein